MTKLLKILKEDIITSIPIYSGGKKLNFIYDKIKKYFPSTPEYIIKDFIDSNLFRFGFEHEGIKKWKETSDKEIPFILAKFPLYIRKNWKLQILYVNPEDFTNQTVTAFIERRFGEENAYLVPHDEKRTKTQEKLARSDGKNEPIVVFKHGNGKYEILEGWHRAMSILKLGDNGEDLKNWNKVKIRAFVSDN